MLRPSIELCTTHGSFVKESPLMWFYRNTAMCRNMWAKKNEMKWHHWSYGGLLFQFETARPSSVFILCICKKGSGGTALSLFTSERGILSDSPWSFERCWWRCRPVKLITPASCDKQMRMTQAFEALLRSLLIKEQPLSSYVKNP